MTPTSPTLPTKKTLFLLTLTLSPLLTTTNQKCSSGCLKCNRRNECLICDIENFYYLRNHSCIYSRPSFCLFALKMNKCLVCKPNFYLDRGQCLRTTTLLQNCLQNNLKECLRCKTGYYLFKGTCLKATHLIPNCSVQKNEFQCQKCALGHTLSPNNESCESHQANTIYRNCSMISSITCSQFQNIYKDWFLMHRKKPFEIQDNIFFKELRRTRSQGDITIPEIYEQIVLSRKENISRVRLVGTGVKFKQTLKENVSSHCDVYVSDNEFFDQNQADLMANSVVQKSLFGSFAFRVFEEVENDPFFEEKIVCRKDFVIKIDLCQEYLNNFQCRRCSAMHFFQNNQCNLHAVIGNCLQYSHSIPQHCENCESGFYFDQGLKTCESRTKLLNNCSEKDPYSEKCLKCDTGFQLKSNFEECLLIPKNCEQIDEASGRCIKCKPHFYLDTSFFCFFPSRKIEKCLIYEDPITCQACEDDYDLRDGKCVASVLYSSIKGNCDEISYINGIFSCKKCASGFTDFQAIKFCDPVSKIVPHCKLYSNTEKCIECESGFYLSNEECMSLTEPNCEINDPTNNVCWKCGFKETLQVPASLVPGNSCIALQSILKKNCNQLNLNLKSPTFPCDSCIAPYVSFNINTSHRSFCLAEFQIDQIDATFKENCRFLKSEKNSITGCRKCKIDDNSNSQMVIYGDRCMENCSHNQFLVETYSRSLDQWFVCRSRNQVILRHCQNCRCAAFDSGIFVSSFIDTIVLDSGVFYTDQEIRGFVDSSVKTGTGLGDHFICRRCPEGHLPVLNSSLLIISPSYSKYDLRPQRFINYFYKKNESYFSFFNFIPEVVECAQYDMDNYDTFPINPSILVKDIYSIYLRVDYSIFFNISDKSTLNNFQLCKGVNVGANKVGCASCVFGYNGYIFYETVEQIHFIPECFFFYECKPEVYWKSLTSEAEFADLHYHVSCHQCKSLDQIVSILTFPVNFESLFEGESPSNYNITLTTLPKNFCYVPGILDGNNDPNGSRFPLNCAIQEVLDLPFKLWDAGTLDENNPVCRVCKPKHRPVYYTHSTLNKRFVQLCEAIPNCAFSDEFNRCSQCDSGYVLEYASVHSLSLRQNCIKNPIENCEISNDAISCLKCRQSFHLLQSTSGDKCLRWSPYYCDEEFSEHESYFDTGCATCLGQFYATTLPYASMNLCLKDSTITNSNCLLLDSNTFCARCKNGLYRVHESAECVTPSISECSVYKSNGDCHECNNTFLLKNGKCTQGYIPGCLKYTDADTCSLCSPKMTLYQLDTKLICVDTSSIFPNCSSITIDNTSSPPQVNCEKCVGHTFLKSMSPIKLCRALEVDRLCKVFDITSPLDCMECIDSAYLVSSSESLTGKKCIPRANPEIFKCAEFKKDADVCERCDDGFFLDHEQMQCNPVVYQIKSCVFYARDYKCLFCKTGQIYDGASCVSVTSAIAQCKYQQIEGECSICNVGFILSEDKTTCDATDLSIERHKKLTCDKILNDPLLRGSDLRIRLLLNSCFAQLEFNCFSYDTSGACLLCLPGFAPNKFGKCEKIDQEIPNCEFYESKGTCQACFEGFMISEDGRHCLRGAFPKSFPMTSNCNQLKTQDNCVLCSPGYQMDLESGVCSKSVKDLECQVIDFDGTCLVCVSGFQMGVDGVCVANGDLVELSEKILLSEK